MESYSTQTNCQHFVQTSVEREREREREREFICHKTKNKHKNILNISTVAGNQKGKPIKLVA